MNLAIAALDGVAACLLFTATVLAALIDLLADRPMRPWAFVTFAFLLLAIERGSNALEWSGTGQFSLLDALQGYLSMLSGLVLAGLAVRFWMVANRVKAAEDDLDA